MVCLLLAVSAGVWFFAGCSDPEPPPEPEFLIRTPGMILTADDFSEELDLKRAAYPYNIKAQPDAYNEMVIHLVRELAEELVLLNAAKALNIGVNEAQLAEAEARFRQDYPEDSFDKMLLKNAISYPFWKKRFKKSLIIERLIESQLTSRMEITSQDIIRFYEQFKTGGFEPAPGETDTATGYTEERLVSRIRMQKTQQQYAEWARALRQTYPVQINNAKLKQFLIDIDPSKEKTHADQ